MNLARRKEVSGRLTTTQYMGHRQSETNRQTERGDRQTNRKPKLKGATERDGQTERDRQTDREGRQTDKQKT